MMGFHLMSQLVGGVTLSGAGVSSSGGGTRTAGFRVNSDGTIDENDQGVYTQLSVSTDWIIPNGDAPDDYEFRFVNLVGDAFQSEASAVDVWIALTSNREYYHQDTNPSPESFQAATYDFEIRKGSAGDAIATGSYSSSAQRTF